MLLLRTRSLDVTGARVVIGEHRRSENSDLRQSYIIEVKTLTSLSKDGAVYKVASTLKQILN